MYCACFTSKETVGIGRPMFNFGRPIVKCTPVINGRKECEERIEEVDSARLELIQASTPTRVSRIAAASRSVSGGLLVNQRAGFFSPWLRSCRRPLRGCPRRTRGRGTASSAAITTSSASSANGRQRQPRSGNAAKGRRKDEAAARSPHERAQRPALR